MDYTEPSYRCKTGQNHNSIKLYYGPYVSNGILRHKRQKLHGIIESLTALNYVVEAIPSPHLNRLTIELKDRVIFMCDITNLKFNLPCETDILCRRILEVVKEHLLYMDSEKNQPQFVNVCEGMRWYLRQQLFGSKEMHRTTSLMEQLYAPCNTMLSGDELEMSTTSWGSGDEYGFDQYSRFFGYDFGCIHYGSVPSHPDSSTSADDSSYRTTSSSCDCFSLEPPSLISACMNPPFTASNPPNFDIFKAYGEMSDNGDGEYFGDMNLVGYDDNGEEEEESTEIQEDGNSLDVCDDQCVRRKQPRIKICVAGKGKTCPGK